MMSGPLTTLCRTVGSYELEVAGQTGFRAFPPTFILLVEGGTNPEAALEICARS
jgi:hypothetical protein